MPGNGRFSTTNATGQAHNKHYPMSPRYQSVIW
jgi:hypothetical protein